MLKADKITPSCVEYREIWESEPEMRLIFLYVYTHTQIQRGADKSLAQLGRKQAAPVRSVIGRGIDLARVGRSGGLLCMS